MKALTLLKMSGLEYNTAAADLRKAPKGKAPYLDDNGEMIADSSFIRRHLESRHGIDFDKGLTEEQKAIGYAFERLCEEQIYWVIVYERWMIPENFERGPAHFFDAVPGPMRGFIKSVAKRRIRANLHGHGMGRHSRDEIVGIAGQGIDALATMLGENKFFLGDEPTGTDATISASVVGLLAENFDSPLVAATRKHANLVAYADRIIERFYPGIA